MASLRLKPMRPNRVIKLGDPALPSSKCPKQRNASRSRRRVAVVIEKVERRKESSTKSNQ